MRKIIFLITLAVLGAATCAWADIFGKPFSDGSPSCTTCHSVAAGGYSISTWGPDLSSLYIDMGEDAEVIADFIKASGIEPMDAVYADSDIPDEEIQALVQAFAGLNPDEASVEGGSNILISAFALF